MAKMSCTNVGAIARSLPVAVFLAIITACASEKSTLPDGIYAQGELRDEGGAAPKEDLAAWGRQFQQDNLVIPTTLQTASRRNFQTPQSAVLAQVQQSGPMDRDKGLGSSQQEESVEEGPSFLSRLGDGFSWLGSGLLTSLEFLGQVAVVAGPQIMQLMQGQSGGSAYALPSYSGFGATGSGLASSGYATGSGNGGASKQASSGGGNRRVSEDCDAIAARYQAEESQHIRESGKRCLGMSVASTMNCDKQNNQHLRQIREQRHRAVQACQAQYSNDGYSPAPGTR
ncbi:MAG: hypothetical protein ABL983_01530 [Nitrospira sp.]